jgi:hypothetical protein
MSAPMEELIRDTLAHRAAAPTPASPDPWEAFTGRERSHRTRRHAVRAGLGITVGGLVAAVAAGALPIPAALPVPVLPAGVSVLSESPTRGSLAGDEAWLDGLRDSVKVDDPEWTIFDRSRIKIHFAGDVPGARVAVMTVRMRRGLTANTETMSVQGKVGASPEEMSPTHTGETGPVFAQLVGNDEGPGYLLVVAPPEASIRTSLGNVYGKDGRVVRNRVTGKVSDGIAIVEVPAAKRWPSTHIRVVQDGQTLFDDSANAIRWTMTPRPPSEVNDEVDVPTAVQEALAASGSSMSLSTAAEFVEKSMEDAVLSTSQTPFRIPWTGILDGQPAALVELAPKDGGRILYAYHGDVRDQRLLIPAEGAETRPLLWRVRADSGALTAEVAVFAPPGTKRAQLVAGSSVTPIQLNDAGFATVTVPLGTVVSVAAFDKDDKLLGTTPLRESASDVDGLPGESSTTRLVP